MHRHIGGGILIALGMGTYQAYFGCACLVFIAYIMIALCEDKNSTRAVFIEFLKFIGAVVIGAILYVLILNVHLKFFHLGMADYNGGDNYSFLNTLRNLTYSIPYAYSTFFEYFFGHSVRLNLLQNVGIFAIFFILAALFLTGGVLRSGRISKMRAVMFVVLCAVVPLACNAILLVATDADMSLHMSGGMALCIPVLLCVEHKIRSAGKAGKYLWKMNLLVILLMIYGNVYQVQADQETMLAGRTSTTTIAETVIQELNNTGNLDSNTRYCILGRPSYSDLYYFSSIMEYSNQYARFGHFNSDDICTRRSWQGVFHYLCGVDLELCTAEEYEAVRNDPDVQKMPSFPGEGSILRIDDVVVVKVSE